MPYPTDMQMVAGGTPYKKVCPQCAPPIHTKNILFHRVRNTVSRCQRVFLCLPESISLPAKEYFFACQTAPCCKVKQPLSEHQTAPVCTSDRGCLREVPTSITNKRRMYARYFTAFLTHRLPSGMVLTTMRSLFVVAAEGKADSRRPCRS